MRIAILSTETYHHTYFINCIASSFNVASVFYETEHLSFPFDTDSPFMEEENAFENRNFFIDIPDAVSDKIPIHRVPNVNVHEFRDMVQAYEADLALVFGCGKIKPHVFSLFNKGLINVHRGIATEYRGLDSDLWAIYHDDFNNIGVTLHFVDEELDTGDITKVERITYTESDKIFHLRYKSTILATEMMIDVISKYCKNELSRMKQTKYGRYYSAMPTVLTAECIKKFDRYIISKFGNKM